MPDLIHHSRSDGLYLSAPEPCDIRVRATGADYVIEWGDLPIYLSRDVLASLTRQCVEAYVDEDLDAIDEVHDWALIGVADRALVRIQRETGAV